MLQMCLRLKESQNTSMCIEFDLADDVRQFAEDYAHANGMTLGNAIIASI